MGSLDNLSLLEMFGSAAPESTNSALLAFRWRQNKLTFISHDISRAIIQQPCKFFLENRSKLFEEHDKEYGTKESEEWKFEGTENLYRGLFNLVCKLFLFWVPLQITKYLNINTFPGEPHGRVDPFKGVRLCHQVCCAPQVLKVTSGLL